jgi:hypothetical protein
MDMDSGYYGSEVFGPIGCSSFGGRRMSHHKKIFDSNGEEIGYLRITNSGYVISVMIMGCDFAPSIQLCHNEMGEEE